MQNRRSTMALVSPCWRRAKTLNGRSEMEPPSPTSSDATTPLFFMRSTPALSNTERTMYVSSGVLNLLPLIQWIMSSFISPRRRARWSNTSNMICTIGAMGNSTCMFTESSLKPVLHSNPTWIVAAARCKIAREKLRTMTKW